MKKGDGTYHERKCVTTRNDGTIQTVIAPSTSGIGSLEVRIGRLREPMESGSKKRKIGLALSGGGFRATLFHLGAVRRLNELGILHELDSVSSVSGGSFLAGLIAVRWSKLSFMDGTTVTGKSG